MKAFQLSIYLFLLIILFTRFSCYDCDDYVTHESPCPLVLNNQSDEILVGDTLSFTAYLNSEFELANGDIYDSSNETITIFYELFKLVASDGQAQEAEESFQILSDSSTTITDRIGEFESSLCSRCNDSNCNFEVSLITETPGYFGILFSRGNFGNSTECRRLFLDPIEIIKDGTNNYELLEEIGRERFWVDGVQFTDPTLPKNLYFFKVVN